MKYTIIVKVTTASLDEVIPNVRFEDVDGIISSMWLKYPTAYLIRAYS